MNNTEELSKDYTVKIPKTHFSKLDIGDDSQIDVELKNYESAVNTFQDHIGGDRLSICLTSKDDDGNYFATGILKLEKLVPGSKIFVTDKLTLVVV